MSIYLPHSLGTGTWSETGRGEFRQSTSGVRVMSKGMDRKKEAKKKPSKTKEEKKAAKKLKR